MKTLCSATKTAAALALTALGLVLPSADARAGLFHRRTVVVETPAVFLAPTPTVYAAPVTAVVASPVVQTTYVEQVVPTSYVVPTVSTTVVSAPAVTTYVPTVFTSPTVLVPATRVRVARPRRTYLNGY